MAAPTGYGQAQADPSFQEQAARAAANDPRVQQAARQEMSNQARSAANSAGRTAANAGREVYTYVSQNPKSLSVLCFCSGLALTVLSILGVINLFNLMDPEQWLVSFYNMGFGLIIAVVDGKPEWMDKCFGVHSKIMRNFGFLQSLRGRAFFYFYVGSTSIMLLPDSDLWLVLYCIIGGVLMAIGLIMLCLSCRGQPVPHQAFQSQDSGAAV
mmetsp:Transcript_106170/g.243063  ORF Transcript_106170/g.243063 Transcript_106170/m.243063 type:complete len:212 (-) Transcript_106170:39-674(-)